MLAAYIVYAWSHTHAQLWYFHSPNQIEKSNSYLFGPEAQGHSFNITVLGRCPNLTSIQKPRGNRVKSAASYYLKKVSNRKNYRSFKWGAVYSCRPIFCKANRCQSLKFKKVGGQGAVAPLVFRRIYVFWPKNLIFKVNFKVLPPSFSMLKV